jgi:chromosome segregation ATPase
MRFLQLVAAAGFFVATVAWAGGQSTRPSNSAATTTPPYQADRQLVRSQVEVKRLEKDLDKRESASKRASERLQQQDQTIAELRQQLQELRTGSARNSH